MEQPSEKLPRVAYSFRSGTFDLQSLCPNLCFQTEDGTSRALQLDDRWEALFAGLGSLGVVLTTVQSGPVCLTDVWEQTTLQRLPHQLEFLDMNTGTELYAQRIHSAMAVVEERGDQQIASLQFFDRVGMGGYKVLLTNGSDINAFSELVMDHAVSSNSVLSKTCRPIQPAPLPTPVVRHVDAAAVRRLWSGLTKTLPSHSFPGLAGVSRLSALQSAGPEYAWEISHAAAVEAMEKMSLRRASMGGAVMSTLAFLPAAFRPTRWSGHGCGQTFYSDYTQFSIRHCQGRWSAWVVRFATDHHEVNCLEFYDQAGRFAGALGLSHDAPLHHHEEWRQHLRLSRI